MKKEFSNKWNGSRQKRKQRKYRANAPNHLKHKMVSSNLSETLKKKYAKKNFPVKKGDEVKVMRGEFKGKKGKVESVDLKKLRVTVEGITRTKKDGNKLTVYFNPSKLQILELNLEDKKRMKSIERKIKIKSDKGVKPNQNVHKKK